ncbi:hypothetical protein [Roseibacillus persicicus]|uniref:Uncharacterized protein n=1 Tax=Roseibacillus persicicus TaxID=454148 RepID=A0A918WF41_9BACT|nr:hypothetical protein [Roseibacillus persicicus]GHC39916.1 hypothetical protein GCM10007100_00210 [Roseibacillus persicicus]
MKNDSESAPKNLSEALTRGFQGSEEKRLQWQAYCEGALSQANEKALQEAETRLAQSARESPQRKRLGKFFSISLIALALLLQALLTKVLLKNYDLGYVELTGKYGFVHGNYGGPLPTPATRKRLSEEELLLLSCGFRHDDEKPAYVTLRERHPDNIAYLCEYLVWAEDPRLKHFERAMELDPDNGWLALFYAGHLADRSLVSNLAYSSRKKDVPRRKIKDQEQFEKALMLMKRASEMTRFERYPNELQVRRANLLLPPKNIAEETEYLVALYPSSDDSMRILSLASAVEVQAHLHVENNDPQSFQELVETALSIIPPLSSEMHGTIGSLTIQNFMRTLGGKLGPMARQLGLETLANRLEDLDNGITKLQDWSKSSPPPKFPVAKYGSPMTELISSYHEKMPGMVQPSVEDLEPARMKFLLKMERSVLSVATGFLTVAALLTFFASFLSAKTTRLAALSLEKALPPYRWLLTLAASFLLPIVGYLIVTRLTPLGGLDRSVTYHAGQPHAYHIASTIALAFLLPVALTSFFTHRQLSRLGLSRPAGWTIWVPCLLVLLTLLSAGLIRYQPQFATEVSGAFGAFGLLFFLCHVLMRVFGPQRNELARILSLRQLAPTFAGLSILFSSLHIAITLRENHWVRQEEFFPQKGDRFHPSPMDATFSRLYSERLDTIIAGSPLFTE